MGKTTVVYKDIAVGASEAATISATRGTPESDPQELTDGVETGKIITLEPCRWTLDGTFGSFYEESDIAFWSTELSDEAGEFVATPVITITLSQQFSGMGVTLTFDAATGEYCASVNIKWYQGDAIKADQDFTPTSAEQFCAKRVESFDKIVITLKKTSLPHRRAKLDRIVFGVLRTFGMNELRSASIVNEMNEAALELPVSTFRWTLDSLSDADYMFQLKQPVEVRNNGSLLGVYYIDNASRKAARVYDIDCHDALGVLSESQFAGGAIYPASAQKTC